MTFNERMIKENVGLYKELFFKQFGSYPTCWFSFFRWLANSTSAHSFNSKEKELAVKLLEV